MRAVEFAEFGGPDVLQVQEVEVPEPGPDDVRVAVRCAGVNPADGKLRAGVMGNPTLPHRPGLELSGAVDAAGAAAGFRVGDEVFGWARGGAYAERALTGVLTRKPAELSWQDAGSLPVAGEAALRGLRLLHVQRGDVLLVHGAGGVVGSLATQLAATRGARILGTCGAHDDDYVRSLGATPVRYGPGLVERVRRVTPWVDAVLDAAGAGVLGDSTVLRGSTERIITLADPAADEHGVVFSGGKPGDRTTGVLTDLAEQVVAGRLVLRHARSYPLTDAARAHRDSETGGHSGKLTLDVS
ncbi:NADP-dependent oxidoreductase [Saccharopolyspora sp. HNM0983]|uniref:NADP-dependent oxidoreductase n=1 Tax=Saccharopolyspora montiporae TaxID=2781240 RepID=A0A929BD04_9PSEU|nr:NADP-dependent oxidoreductase [Saccharopolyspora sp. HNM0983]MBE9375348.1 NADP-dependent oxidoreductase [Saccharopolyspora sp. HNM0983]